MRGGHHNDYQRGGYGPSRKRYNRDWFDHQEQNPDYYRYEMDRAPIPNYKKYPPPYLDERRDVRENRFSLLIQMYLPP